MLGLFRRTKIEPWEISLLRNTIRLLPAEYRYLEKQIDEGLFRGVLVGLSDLPGYVSFRYNPPIFRKFDDKRSKSFKLTGINVLDSKSNTNLIYTIYVSTGTINGYSITEAKKFIADTNSVDVNSVKKQYLINPDYQKIESLLTADEKKLINSGDVYEIILNDKTYFHIKDLEDGDFIGIDYNKNSYKITHDPYGIKRLNYGLVEILNNSYIS